MIRLPKATKTPQKSKVIPRQSLANIVKDLGESTSCDITAFFYLLWLAVKSCCVSAAISAPLKLKASKGPSTPINRNQASQPRMGQSLLGKRGFDSVSSHVFILCVHSEPAHLIHNEAVCCVYAHWFPLLLSDWTTGFRGSLPSQWEAVHFRYEDHISVSHQEAEGQPRGGTKPGGVCGDKGHQVCLTHRGWRTNTLKHSLKTCLCLKGWSWKVLDCYVSWTWPSNSLVLPPQSSKETPDPVWDASSSEEASPAGADQTAPPSSFPGHAPAPLQHQRTHRPGGLRRRDTRGGSSSGHGGGSGWVGSGGGVCAQAVT